MIKRYFKNNAYGIIFSLVSILFMWAVWTAAYYSVGNDLIIPSFSDTAVEFFALFANGGFWTAILNSLWRTLLAFAVSFLLAALCACLAALNCYVKIFFKPVMTVIRTLPTMAVILIILKITSGNRSLSPVIVAFLVLFPMIYSQLTAAIEGVDGGLLEMAKIFDISKKDKIFKIYLPAVAPSVLSQSGANISLGLKVVISAEVLANTAKGLGGSMQLASISAEVALLSALTLSAVFLGLIIEVIFSVLRKFTFKWNAREKVNDSD